MPSNIVTLRIHDTVAFSHAVRWVDYHSGSAIGGPSLFGSGPYENTIVYDQGTYDYIFLNGSGLTPFSALIPDSYQTSPTVSGDLYVETQPNNQTPVLTFVPSPASSAIIGFPDWFWCSAAQAKTAFIAGQVSGLSLALGVIVWQWYKASSKAAMGGTLDI